MASGNCQANPRKAAQADAIARALQGCGQSRMLSKTETLSIWLKPAKKNGFGRGLSPWGFPSAIMR